MSAAVSRRCLTTGGVALAVVLATPIAALADPGDRAARGEGRPTSAPSPQAEQSPQAEPSPRADRPRGASARPERSAAGDPRGDNGTVMVDGEPFGDGRGNEPHVGCAFRLVFRGFDAGDTASITVTGQAPTGGGLLHSESGTLVSRDAAGGGQDLDETVVLGVDDELAELRAVAPHPQQGWHVKVAVDVDGAPGGAKQKVLWLECPAASGTAVTGTTTAAGTTDLPTTDVPSTGGAGTVTTTPTTEVPAAGVAGTSATVPLAGGLTLGSGTTTVAPAREVGGGVTAQSAVAPTALPFTGAQSVGALVALGVGSLLAGGAAHALGRRREALA